jgi:hypothetical protein
MNQIEKLALPTRTDYEPSVLFVGYGRVVDGTFLVSGNPSTKANKDIRYPINLSALCK